MPSFRLSLCRQTLGYAIVVVVIPVMGLVVLCGIFSRSRCSNVYTALDINVSMDANKTQGFRESGLAYASVSQGGPPSMDGSFFVFSLAFQISSVVSVKTSLSNRLSSSMANTRSSPEIDAFFQALVVEFLVVGMQFTSYLERRLR